MIEYIFLSGVILILIYIIFNLLRKNEKYEDIIEEQNILVESQNNTLNEIYIEITKSKEFINTVDEKGIFQGDDEVGIFFGYLKNIQSSLDEYFKNIENAKS